MSLSNDEQLQPHTPSVDPALGPIEYPHPKPNPRLPVPEQRELKCRLTEAEVRSRADDMADAELRIADLKSQRAGINGEINDLRAQRKKLATVVDSCEETRMVPCTWSEDRDHGVFRCHRTDTGVEIASRTMSAADHQEGFDFDSETGEVLAANDNGRDDDAGPDDEDGDSDDDDEDEEPSGSVAEVSKAVQAFVAGAPSKRKRTAAPARTAAKRPAAAAAKGGGGNGKRKAPKGKRHTRHSHR